METNFAREQLSRKPFVFVLMPFDSSFNDIYKYGIRGAADDVGAYAERVNDQIFNEGILEHIFNQINHADVIVADMTGRNANVFYEVGYAHALEKIVLLLTQDANDIPFDLKHRQHIVYGGRIEVLRRDLAQRLRWAIQEATRDAAGVRPSEMSVLLEDKELALGYEPSPEPVTVETDVEPLGLRLVIRNNGSRTLPPFDYIYLFARPDCRVVPSSYVDETVDAVRHVPTPIHSTRAATRDSPDGLSHQYRLPIRLRQIPSGAFESSYLSFLVPAGTDSAERYRLRFHGEDGVIDFSFILRIQPQKLQPQRTKRTKQGSTAKRRTATNNAVSTRNRS